MNDHGPVVKLLLDTGEVNIDLEDSHGKAPLSYALENGSESVVNLLLETGKVDVNYESDFRRTP